MTNNTSLDLTINPMVEIEKIINTLIEDEEILTKAYHLIEDKTVREQGSYRRHLTKAIFTKHEGLLFGLRHLMLSNNSRMIEKFTTEEIHVLREKKVIIDSGQAVIKDNFQNGKSMLLFTINSYAKFIDYDFKVDTSRHEWCEYKKLIIIRNRLTHPKSSAELIITLEDMDVIEDGNIWLGEIFNNLLSNSTGNIFIKS